MKNKKVFIWLIPILYILAIFNNSLQVGETSGNLSKTITIFVSNLLNRIYVSVDFDILHFFIRKLAHFSEYALLGLIIYFTIKYYALLKSHFINNVIFFIFVPIMDETIQLFVPGRCGAIRDVLIDMSGYIFGTLIAYILYLIIKDIKSRLSK